MQKAKTMVSTTGSSALIYLARPGWWYGALEIFTRRPRRFHVAARTDCKLLFLPGEICTLAPDRWEAFAAPMCANREAVADAIDDARPLARTSRGSGPAHAALVDGPYVAERRMASAGNATWRIVPRRGGDPGLCERNGFFRGSSRPLAT